MRILITGVSGFIGRRLACSLINMGHEVYGIGFRRDQCELNDWFGIQWDKLHYDEIDITDPVAVHGCFDEIHPRFVYHLAAQANIRTARRNPLSTYRVNIEGTHNVLDACLNEGVQGVHLASSSDVYGPVDEEQQPICEAMPLRGTNPYAVSKIAMECIGRAAYEACEHLNVIITRLFTCAGPGQYIDSAVSYFAWQAARIKLNHQEPVLKCGNIDNYRTFIHVGDVIWAINKFPGLNRSDTFEGNVFNLTGDREVSLRYIVDELCALSGKEVEIQQDPSAMRKQDITRQIGEGSRIWDAIGVRPHKDVGDIIKETFEWWIAKLE